MSRTLRVLSVGLTLSLLCLGCRTSVRMDPEVQSRLHALHFSREFEGAEKPYISDGGLMMFGLIGAVASIAQTQSRQEQLLNTMKANGIDVREMVFARLVERLLLAGYAPVREPRQADATLQDRRFAHGSQQTPRPARQASRAAIAKLSR